MYKQTFIHVHKAYVSINSFDDLFSSSTMCLSFVCPLTCQVSVKNTVKHMYTWSGPVSVYCDEVGCHVLCLYTVTRWGVMSCVCIL